MSAAVLQMSPVLVLVQLLLTTMDAPEAGAPQPIAVTRCLEFQQPLSEQPRRTREHRHGWYYRLAEKADALARRRIPVRGGLIPTPNVAAQAGSIDPAMAATAMSGGDQQRQRLAVRRAPTLQLRPIDLSCR